MARSALSGRGDTVQRPCVKKGVRQLRRTVALASQTPAMGKFRIDLRLAAHAKSTDPRTQETAAMGTRYLLGRFPNDRTIAGGSG